MKLKQGILLVAALLTASSAFASESIAKRSGCFSCHQIDKKVVGPAYKDVAAKYKGQPDAVAKLTEKVRKGGAGVWGDVPMTPNPPERINDANLKSVIDWILSL